MLQHATPLWKKAPGPPNSSDEHVSCIAPATENASLQILFKCPSPAIVFGNATKPSRFAHFWHGAQSLAPVTRNDIWTSKSVPNMWCFEHFDFEMCFAPQRRALFRHLNLQECSGADVLCAFWLRNVLRTTMACTFSTLQLRKVLRTCGVLYILTSKCVSRHNGVHFFDISTSKSASELTCFVHFDFEMCFAPQRCAIFSSLIWPAGSAPAALASLLFDLPEPQIIGKTHCSRLSYLFAHLDLLSSETFSFWASFFFSSLLFSSLTLPISAFHLSILSEVWLLNFLR